MTEYSQGVCQDGAAILKDGQMMTIDELIETLRALQSDSDRLQHLVGSGAFRLGSADMGSNHTWVGVGRPIDKGPDVRSAIDKAMMSEHIVSAHNGGDR